MWEQGEQWETAGSANHVIMRFDTLRGDNRNEAAREAIGAVIRM
jgi:hypothetical protein